MTQPKNDLAYLRSEKAKAEHKYIDMVLNKQQLSAPGGKTPEKESVLKRLHKAKATAATENPNL